MNTFSAFRFAARTLLHPRLTHFPCLNPVVLSPRTQFRFKSKKAVVQRPRNDQIPYEEVSLAEDNVLVKMSLRRLLSSIDLKEQWVELVAENPMPIVRIINKKVRLAKQKELKKSQRESTRKNIVKEVQLTWSSEQSDLEHKLARVRTYLEIGAKVDVVFSTKAKTNSPSPAVMNQKLQDTIEMMADVSTEAKPVEWRKNMAVIHLRGIVDPKRTLTPEQIQLAAEEKAAEEGADREAEGDEHVARKAEGDEPTTQKEPTPEPTPEPVLPPPQPKSRPTEPPKPKNFIDLSSYGFQPPVRKNSRVGTQQVVKKQQQERPQRYGSSPRPSR
ncbi:hypothetical protein FB451DRAFT_1073633 [Mycena latifolia]|nr:hypothetical protein FB451DRAFT_1073633 [Mycena latifolia]